MGQLLIIVSWRLLLYCNFNIVWIYKNNDNDKSQLQQQPLLCWLMYILPRGIGMHKKVKTSRYQVLSLHVYFKFIIFECQCLYYKWNIFHMFDIQVIFSSKVKFLAAHWLWCVLVQIALCILNSKCICSTTDCFQHKNYCDFRNIICEIHYNVWKLNNIKSFFIHDSILFTIIVVYLYNWTELVTFPRKPNATLMHSISLSENVKSLLETKWIQFKYPVFPFQKLGPLTPCHS